MMEIMQMGQQRTQEKVDRFNKYLGFGYQEKREDVIEGECSKVMLGFLLRPNIFFLLVKLT